MQGFIVSPDQCSQVVFLRGVVLEPPALDLPESEDSSLNV